MIINPIKGEDFTKTGTQIYALKQYSLSGCFSFTFSAKQLEENLDNKEEKNICILSWKGFLISY